ncbi:MAG: hypothetical protein MUC48_24770 [Leptolyngbya sp. Prado105]|jgi:hypothetical protein|nr:hypothetical protein [Leptolyngbya sp. Prado105]
MTIAELRNLVSYITDAEGKQTSVIVPQAVWSEILQTLERLESGLDPIDENEPNSQILADLTEAIRDTQAGDTFPVSQLWEKVYE